VATITDRVIRIVDEHHNYWTPMMEMTRGCPRNCSFCTAIRVSGQRMRLRPIDEVVDEIQRRRIRRFFLTDDNFGLAFHTNPDYIEALLKALARLPLTGWTAQAEMLVSAHPDLLDLAYRAHLDKLFIGFESVNPDNHKELGGKSKGAVAQYRQAIHDIQSHGIGVAGLFVFGFDNDTPQTLAETWDFVRSSQLDSVSMTVLTPYPGTPFRQQLINEGRLLDKPWRYYDTAHVTYIPKRMTIQEMEQAYDWFCRQAYGATSMARRGLGTLVRYPVNRLPRKVWGNVLTDYGYRRTYAWRNVDGDRLLNAARRKPDAWDRTQTTLTRR
jgi:radical SAM superfamily enzyme YgiQ (UPF0313 family)